MTDIELLPLHLLEAFSAALKGERGELDAWLEVNNEADVRLHVDAYARANVAHATAAKDAEIEALRAEVDRMTEMAMMQAARAAAAEREASHRKARTERLVEALRGVLPFVVSDVLEHCDGNKCREQWCAGCMGDDYAAEQVERARAAAHSARAALRDHDQEGKG